MSVDLHFKGFNRDQPINALRQGTRMPLQERYDMDIITLLFTFLKCKKI
jgi:hypothetical protein